MSDLPSPIRDFILTLTDETLSPAYLLISEKDGLADWGGDLDSYGITNLKEHMEVSAQVPFLVGLLPLGTSSVFLPRVQTKTDVFADVYLFTREQGTWVLLLDATADSAKRLSMQQKLYDSRLQVADLAREGEALYKANAFLEELVRERTAELTQTVLHLKQELAERQRVERELRENQARRQAP
jgi:hypothetical protein